MTVGAEMYRPDLPEGSANPYGNPNQVNEAASLGEVRPPSLLLPHNLESYRRIFEKAATLDLHPMELSVSTEQPFAECVQQELADNLVEYNAKLATNAPAVSPARATKWLRSHFATYSNFYATGVISPMAQQKRYEDVAKNIFFARKRGQNYPETHWSMGLSHNLDEANYKHAAEAVSLLVAAYGWALRIDAEATDGRSSSWLNRP